MTQSLCLYCRRQFDEHKGGARGWYCSPGCASRDVEFSATWEQIGEAIGCTKQRAQQIAAAALKKIAPHMKELR